MLIQRGRPPLLYEGLSIFLDMWNTPSVNVTGGKISQLSDISGNGIHAKQTVDANRPDYVASGYGGKPEMALSTSKWMLAKKEPTTIQVQVAEVFIICNYTGGATFVNEAGLFTSEGGTPTPFIVGQMGTSNFEYEGYVSGGGNAFNDFTAHNGVPGFNFSPMSTMKLVNSQANITAGTGGINSIRAEGYQLGKDRADTDRHWTGSFVALLAYALPCSTAKRNYIGKYLADRYGLTIATLI